MPIVDAVIAEDLGTTLGHVSVFEVPTSERMIFRLVGAWYDEVADRSLVGENFMEMVAENQRPIRKERMWTLASVPCGGVTHFSHLRPSGENVPGGALLLPVKPKSSDDPMRIYTAVDVFDDVSRLGDDGVSVFSLAHEFIYIDIGYGAAA